jgi:XTP/dITP diphosphohydrolase
VERTPIPLLLASSNAGKLREYRELAHGSSLDLRLLPDFRSLPLFEESAPTFAENAAGKALHYSRFTADIVLSDDSGLVVPALGGAPGVYSARYAGPNATDADGVQKLLRDMQDIRGAERRARFVCVIAMARQGRTLAIFSDFVEGLISRAPRGVGGFGYDPVFTLPTLQRTFAELKPEEKNQYSHRGRAFLKLCELLFQLNCSLPSASPSIQS